VRQSLVRSGLVPAAWVAGFVLVVAGCTQPNQTGSNSPEASPSTSPTTTTPGTAPPPLESPPAATPPTVASPSPAKLIIRSLPFHIGEVGVTYGAVTLVAAGGVKPYKWSIQAGSLPAGVALSTGGKATGKPTTVGTFSFSVRVDDSAGAAAGAPSSILVFRQLALAGGTCYGNYTTGCTVNLKLSGGVPGVTPSVRIASVSQNPNPVPGQGMCWTPSATAPPTGYGLTVGGGVVTLTIPKGLIGGYGAIWTLVLTDKSSCPPSLLCSSPAATVPIGVQCG
jgi:hypothetical protein